MSLMSILGIGIRVSKVLFFVLRSIISLAGIPPEHFVPVLYSWANSPRVVAST